MSFVVKNIIRWVPLDKLEQFTVRWIGVDILELLGFEFFQVIHSIGTKVLPFPN